MEKTIKLTLEKAKELYGKSKEMDQLLEANFTKEELKPFHYTDITTVQQAIAHLGYDFDVWTSRPMEENDEWAYRMMKIVIKAINSPGWKPKFGEKQRNYYCYWAVRSDGSGFSSSTYYFDFTDTYVGSRLYFEDEARARHFAQHFIHLAKAFYLPEK